jgi:hypothetical protein
MFLSMLLHVRYFARKLLGRDIVHTEKIESNFLEIQVMVERINAKVADFENKFKVKYQLLLDRGQLTKDDHRIYELGIMLNELRNRLGTIFDKSQSRGRHVDQAVEMSPEFFTVLEIQQFLLQMLREIEQYADELQKNLTPEQQNAHLLNLYKHLRTICNDGARMVDLKERIKLKLGKVIQKIINNKRRLDPDDANLSVCLGLSRRELVMLQYLTVLDYGQYNRSPIMYREHGDTTFEGVKHQNLILNGENIHIIPREEEAHFYAYLKKHPQLVFTQR